MAPRKNECAGIHFSISKQTCTYRAVETRGRKKKSLFAESLIHFIISANRRRLSSSAFTQTFLFDFSLRVLLLFVCFFQCRGGIQHNAINEKVLRSRCTKIYYSKFQLKIKIILRKFLRSS